MKKIFAIVLAFVLMTMAASALAADIKVVVNGEEVQFDRVPTLDGENVWIPYRFVAEKLGGNVSWHQDTQTIFTEYNGSIITTQIGNSLLFVNDKMYNLDSAPVLDIDRTMVLGSVFENGMGAKVSWDAATSTVTIEK